MGGSQCWKFLMMLHFVQISYQKVILQILLYNCIDQKKIYTHNLHQCHCRKGLLKAITKFYPCWQISTRLSGFISNIIAQIKPGFSSSPCSTVFHSHCSSPPQHLPIILQPILLWMNISQCVFCVVCFYDFLRPEMFNVYSLSSLFSYWAETNAPDHSSYSEPVWLQQKS